MVVFDLFSKRKKRAQSSVDDVFQYEKISQKLRTQIVHIWNDALGSYDDFRGYGHADAHESYTSLVRALRREYGVFCLVEDRHNAKDEFHELINFFLQEEKIERVLDVIELSFKLIAIRAESGRYDWADIGHTAIKELNVRFREDSTGYQFENEQIMRIDSLHLHQQNILPALKILNEKRFSNANEEFRSAIEHQKNQKNQEAIADCLKCFESVMKIVLTEHREQEIENLPASKLIERVFRAELIPKYLTNEFNSLRSILESGLPTVRNKTSGHGQGAIKKNIPNAMVDFCINVTAANINLLARASDQNASD
ncbi:STM4504/CBY_0614 family protein [Celeribacter naphthalenivorans]|uniref:STM4504/CBY_0614 family protein n=1 Tax=Celeribacter naphthalenivorans TaxID=1614694 RepID=UPI001CFA5537|nr:hypothetical protein [Celeribacter naphthalenivorans]